MTQYDFSSLHILVVEDNDYMRGLILSMLESVGVNKIVSAGSLKETVSLLQIRLPDLLLLDRQLPDGDGLELLKTLRGAKKRAYAELPVIIITAHGDATSVLQAHKGGATAFIVKPLSSDTLIKRVVWALEQADEQGEHKLTS